MAITHSYVDYGAGSDVTGTGAIGTPWKTLQWAFDHLVRNATDGNQVNLKAGTAHVNAAALDLTTLIAGGALAGAGPLIVRGCTATANDGGTGIIDCGGVAMWAGAYDYVYLIDLEIHTFGNNNGITLGQAQLRRCTVHKGASSPSGKYLFVSAAHYVGITGCRFYAPGAGAGRAISLTGATGIEISGNYVHMGANATGLGILTGGGATVRGNIVLCGNTAQIGIQCESTGSTIEGNVCYNSTAGTARGIYYSSSDARVRIRNNIVVGWSGTGGDGIEAAGNAAWLGYNAFYGCTNTNTVADQVFYDLRAGDISLAADPFTDAANGDFSLTAAGKAALRGLGWPGAYLGANAATDGHVTIGAIQYGEAEAGGGAVSIAPMHGGLIG